MKRRHFLLLAACCLAGLLPGCSFPMTENMQVEELLRAPRLSGDYGALQNALNDWLGESAQLKYPMQGDLLSPFLLQDLDGDGEQDAAVLYTTAQSSNVCIAFLQRDEENRWKVCQSIEGLADTVDNVRLAQLQDGSSMQMVVGYLASQGDSYLAVYSYENGQVSAILEQSYEQYLVEDITGGGNQVMMLTASARRFSSSIRKRALTKKSTLTLFTPRRKSCATLKFIRMLILKRYHRFTSIPMSVRRMRHRAKSPISSNLLRTSTISLIRNSGISFAEKSVHS